MMHWWPPYYGGFGWYSFLPLLFLGLILVGGYFLLRSYLAGTQKALLGEDPREILRKRYARGEISKEEYLAMKKDLED
ncbi:MAG: SHOCT domain-containing protein [Firmicutes bacterium]|nr:SHOCT domain-containing protein [Bacillota bacterium]